MYLSKRNGIYYIWYKDENGKKQKVSTQCVKKTDAFEVLRSFQAPNIHIRTTAPTLSEFYSELSKYLTSTYRSSTLDLYKRSWDHLISIVGDCRICRLHRKVIVNSSAVHCVTTVHISCNCPSPN